MFAYSDISHTAVMQLASRALACGADFVLLGPNRTMLSCDKPVIAISAVRTGCGKSQIARWLGRHARASGRRVAVLRHPMPYGDLAAQRLQRFATKPDLDDAECTAEEREEYEPHIAARNVVYAGVDYAAIVERAQQEADLLVWDGGNNDFPFLRPDLHLVLVDALRPDQATGYHPGETNLRLADVIIVNKVDAASNAAVQEAIDNARAINSRATVVRAASPATADDTERLHGQRVLVVEDGPTITHGGMSYGAGYVAATAAGATIVDPRHRHQDRSSRSSIATHTSHGFCPRSATGAHSWRRCGIASTAPTPKSSSAATPIDLAALIELNKPVVRVRYEFAEAGLPTLASIVDEFLDRHVPGRLKP